MKKSFVAVLAGALLLTPGLTSAESQARSAAPSPRITLAVSDGSVTAGTRVTLRGTARGGPFRGGLVRLQVRTDTGWARAGKDRLQRGRYVVRVAPGVGDHRYRVVATRARGGARVTSPPRTVTVTRSAPQPGGALARARATILAATNDYRAAEGLAPLRARGGLDDVAQDWSRTMAATGRLEHNPDYAGQIPKGWTRAGENVAFGFSVREVTRAWWGSPGHRANLLGDYTHLGVGYALSEDGVPYFTQNFARY